MQGCLKAGELVVVWLSPARNSQAGYAFMESLDWVPIDGGGDTEIAYLSYRQGQLLVRLNEFKDADGNSIIYNCRVRQGLSIEDIGSGRVYLDRCNASWRSLEHLTTYNRYEGSLEPWQLERFHGVFSGEVESYVLEW